MQDEPIVFVDVETDGMSAVNGHVTEVAAIKVQGSAVIDTFTTLVNPGVRIPAFITQLTGIDDAAVAAAPRFSDIALQLHTFLQGAVFAAHNVRFDYSFLKQEFKRAGLTFRPRMFCTARLSRALYPEQRRHRLSDLIAAHDLSYTARHRAHDDAYALVQFWHIAVQQHGADTVSKLVAAQKRRSSLPKHLDPSLLAGLPRGFGVYIFEGERGAPLYVGKSVHIRNRVLSHFARDTEEFREFKIAEQIHHIRTIETPGELSALLLESQLVKDMQPIYNRKLRRQKMLSVVRSRRNEAGYEVLSRENLEQFDPDELAGMRGVFSSHRAAQRTLLQAVDTYDLCRKLSGLEKGSGACFAYQLGKCRGACTGREPAEAYNARIAIAFEHKALIAWPFNGPVVLYETSASGQAGYIVDQWIVLAEVVQDDGCEPTLRPHQAVFDVDAYDILQRFILRKTSALTIRPYDGSLGDVRLTQPSQ